MPDEIGHYHFDLHLVDHSFSFRLNRVMKPRAVPVGVVEVPVAVVHFAMLRQKSNGILIY